MVMLVIVSSYFVFSVSITPYMYILLLHPLCVVCRVCMYIVYEYEY